MAISSPPLFHSEGRQNGLAYSGLIQQIQRMRSLKRVIEVTIGITFAASLAEAQPNPATNNLSSSQAVLTGLQPTGIWSGDVGGGFRPGVQNLDLEAGGGACLALFGSHLNRDLSLFDLSYGRTWGGPVGSGHWYHGNWEVRGELFGGVQFNPAGNWLVGLTPHLRYDFATGTRWVPFVDAGAGVTATGIRRPDLGGTFEFNEQVNFGVDWFVRDDIALTFEVGGMHVSSAGIYQPNSGLNCVKGMAGISWFF
jgi:hypothetical protein